MESSSFIEIFNFLLRIKLQNRIKLHAHNCIYKFSIDLSLSNGDAASSLWSAWAYARAALTSLNALYHLVVNSERAHIRIFAHQYFIKATAA